MRFLDKIYTAIYACKRKKNARNPIFNNNTHVNTHSPINQNPLKITAFCEFLTTLKTLAWMSFNQNV